MIAQQGVFQDGYRARMSAPELEIFDGMTKGQQAEYLLNAKRASDLAEGLFPATSQRGGRGDAFRHAYFSGLNAYSLGVDIAKRLGDAHELLANQGDLESRMDLFNNQVGRDLYVSLKAQGLDGHFFSGALGIEVMNAMNQGMLRQIVPILGLVPTD